MRTAVFVGIGLLLAPAAVIGQRDDRVAKLASEQRGAGSHSNDAEFIYVSSIEPRLYLLSRMIMDVASGKAAAGK